MKLSTAEELVEVAERDRDSYGGRGDRKCEIMAE